VTVSTGAADGWWGVKLTWPDDGTTTSVEGTSHSGVLTFAVATPFNRVAFAAAWSPRPPAGP